MQNNIEEQGEEQLKEQSLFEFETDLEIEEEGIDSSVLMERPFDPTKINIETKTPSLDTLISRIREKEIQMETETYFQRKDDLWDAGKQSRLIESILIRFPLPAFFFDASIDSNWLVVDGLQRLSSIRNFCVSKTLKLSNLEFLTTLNGLGWDDLSADLQRIIREAQVVIYKILPGTPVDVKFNIFKRINTGGLVLDSQEIRHALFQGKPADYIKLLASNTEFKKATGNKIKSHRMQDRDFANRFLCFYLLGVSNYNSDLDTYMSKAMANIENLTDGELEKINQDFSKAMSLAYSIFGDESFRKITKIGRKPPINKALFDAISTQFALLTFDEVNKLKTNKTSLKRFLRDELAHDSEFFISVSSSTGARHRVLKRHNKIKEIINKTLEK